MRQQQEIKSAQDAFPSLVAGAGESTSGSGPLRTGWMAAAQSVPLGSIKRQIRPAEQVTKEDFPSLGGPSGGGGNGSKSNTAMVKKGTATCRQFAAMTNSASQKQPPTAAAAGGASWSAASAASNSRPATSHGNFLTPSMASMSVNSQANLASINFPALGGGGGSANNGNPYAAANALDKRNQQRRKSILLGRASTIHD